MSYPRFIKFPAWEGSYSHEVEVRSGRETEYVEMDRRRPSEIDANKIVQVAHNIADVLGWSIDSVWSHPDAAFIDALAIETRFRVYASPLTEEQFERLVVRGAGASLGRWKDDAEKVQLDGGRGDY